MTSNPSGVAGELAKESTGVFSMPPVMRCGFGRFGAERRRSIGSEASPGH